MRGLPHIPIFAFDLSLQTMRRMLIINAGPALRSIWSVVKGWIDPVTVKKITVSAYVMSLLRLRCSSVVWMLLLKLQTLAAIAQRFEEELFMPQLR
jgi:hypothetical protein